MVCKSSGLFRALSPVKLYRGLKSSEFKPYSSDIESDLKNIWGAILIRRSKGDWTFPKDLASGVLRAEKNLRLQRQHFTDRQEIALNYAKANKGVLVEIDVPQKEILSFFRIEFQNFGQRKKKFEIVYVIDAALLHRNRKKWKLKVISKDGLL